MGKPGWRFCIMSWWFFPGHRLSVEHVNIVVNYLYSCFRAAEVSSIQNNGIFVKHAGWLLPARGASTSYHQGLTPLVSCSVVDVRIIKNASIHSSEYQDCISVGHASMVRPSRNVNLLLRVLTQITQGDLNKIVPELALVNSSKDVDDLTDTSKWVAINVVAGKILELLFLPLPFWVN